MVGEEGLPETNDINTLQEGAGKSWALKRKEIFERYPHHRQKKTGFVYFIQADDRIKIGFSKKPSDRLKALQTSHPKTLTLVGSIPGSYQTESRLHRQFRHLKQKGEWFVTRPELMDFILRVTGQRKKAPEPEIEADPPRAPDPAVCRTIAGLIRSRRGASQKKRLLMTNLIEQLRNYNREGNPMARSNLEWMINWSVQAIAKAA